MSEVESLVLYNNASKAYRLKYGYTVLAEVDYFGSNRCLNVSLGVDGNFRSATIISMESELIESVFNNKNGNYIKIKG